MGILCVTIMVEGARADDLVPGGGAVICEDSTQALRYVLGDEVKRRVMRQVRRCWRVSRPDWSPAGTARLEELLGDDRSRIRDAPRR